MVAMERSQSNALRQAQGERMCSGAGALMQVQM
jgi:hypothetical protein